MSRKEQSLLFNANNTIAHATRFARCSFTKKKSLPPVVVSISGRFFPDARPTGRFKPEQIEELEGMGKFLWFVRGRECWVDKEAMERRARMNMMRVVGRINEKNVSGCASRFCVIHGGADRTVPVVDGREFSTRIVGAEYTEIEGATHNFNGTKYLAELLAPMLKLIGKVREEVK